MATYYVRAGGSNAAAGTTGAPWQTVAYAVTQLEPGDTLLVGDGPWPATTISISGAPGAPITIKAENKHGAFFDTNAYASILVSGNYVVIDGLRVRSHSRHGIEFQYCHHLTVRNCLVENCGGNGIGGLQCDWILIEDNVTRRNGRTGWNSGISFYQPDHRFSGDDETPGSSRNIIRRNFSYENHMLAFIPFDTGTVEIMPGDIVEIGDNTSWGIADRVERTSGTWGSNAAGRIGILLRGISSSPANNAVIKINGVTCALVNSSSGYYTDDGMFTDGNGIILDDWGWWQTSDRWLKYRSRTGAISPGNTISVGGTSTATVVMVRTLSATEGYIRVSTTSGSAPVDGQAISVSGTQRATADGNAGYDHYGYMFGALVEENVVYSNGGKGIQFYGVATMGDDHGVARNNTLWHNNRDAMQIGGMTWRGELTGQDSAPHFINNLAVADTSADSNIGPIGLWQMAGASLSNNITFGGSINVNVAWTNGGGNQFGVDPWLVDPANGDFRVASNSPAANAGTGGVTIGAVQELGPEYVSPELPISAPAPGDISSIDYGARTNTTIPAPENEIPDGALILLPMFSVGLGGAVPAHTPPAGFEAVPGAIRSFGDGAGNFGILRFWYKYADDESGSYTVNHASCSTAAGIVVLWGATIDDVVVTTNQGVQNVASYTGVTVDFPNGFTITAGSDWADYSNDLSPPGDLAELIERVTLYVAGGQMDGMTIPTRTQTNNNIPWATWSPWSTIVLAIRPGDDPPAAPTGLGVIIL